MTGRLSGLALTMLLSSTAAQAGAGAQSAAFLKIGAGPRAIGMGEAHTALADDAYAAYWNPAGLAAVRESQLAMTYARALEGIDHQYVSLAVPTSLGLALGANLTRLGMSEIEGFDAAGRKAEAVRSSDYAAGLSAAKILWRSASEAAALAAGINVKAVQQTLGDATARTGAADVGVILDIVPDRDQWSKGLAQEWRLGLAARNLGPGLKFDRRRPELPASYALGLAWTRGGLSLTTDQSLGPDGFRSAFGLEYELTPAVLLRTGYRTGQETGLGLRAGVGLRFGVAQLDYALSDFGGLGQMHRAGLTFRFGGWSAGRVAVGPSVASMLEEGKQLYRTGHYRLALEAFERALDMDPGNDIAQAWVHRIHRKIEGSR